MKRIIIIFFIVILFSGFEFNFNLDKRSDVEKQAMSQLEIGAEYAGYSDEPADPRVIASRAIQMFLGLMGAAFTYLFVYSGYHMITSHGEEEKITRARKTMQGAVIGLMLTLMAFSIAYFVGRRVTEVTGVGYNGSYTDQFYI
ncbi:hypothetical protein HOF40_03420 [Candidatus Parcubacteria bacterium]|jgi:hypothetical protein|nr:hypothetical protein [Candidatus Parcubacteria bacterium]MBT3949112.1 hypothetical protein [Candidatus Parcubacteria bacterium]